jgi:1-acyl-sn-glycerol-3-phosphate acyltransferase
MVATGLAFAAIFFGGGVVAVTVMPLLAVIPGHQRERCQMVIHRLFRFYLFMLQTMGLLRWEVEGADKLVIPGGRLVVANHPSLLDVVMLMALMPGAQCIVKHQLWEHRFLGPLMRRCGYIRNDLEPEALLEACRASLDAGNSLIIFPEGTRTEPGQPVRFRRGFANLATVTGAPVQPVVITVDPPTLIKGEPWWRIPERPPLFRVRVDECLDDASYMGYPYRSLAARKLVETLQAYYSEKLNVGH